MSFPSYYLSVFLVKEVFYLVGDKTQLGYDLVGLGW